MESESVQVLTAEIAEYAENKREGMKRSLSDSATFAFPSEADGYYLGMRVQGRRFVEDGQAIAALRRLGGPAQSNSDGDRIPLLAAFFGGIFDMIPALFYNLTAKFTKGIMIMVEQSALFEL